MSELKLGIGLLPDEEARNILILMSRKLSQNYTASYTLDGKNYHPHLTLFQNKFKSYKDAVSGVNDAIDEYTQVPEIVIGNVGLFAETFVFHDCKKTNSLYYLQDLIIEMSNEYIIKSTEPIGREQNLSGMTEQEIQSLNDYGYPFAGEAFRPHFTIGRIIDSKPDEGELRSLFADDILHLDGHKIQPKEIIIYKAGIDGSCVKILKRQELIF